MSSHTVDHGIVIGLFWLIFRVLFWIILGTVLAQVLTIGLLFFCGANVVLPALNHLLLEQVTTLNAMAQHIEGLAQPVGQIIQVLCHLEQSAMNLAQHFSVAASQVNSVWFSGVVASLTPLGKSMLLVATSTAVLSLLRLACWLCFLPIVFWLGLIALVDGLVRRKVRTYQGGRESALLYHRARSAILGFLIASLLVALLLPMNLQPDIWLLPFAVGFAFAVTLTASRFKKYV